MRPYNFLSVSTISVVPVQLMDALIQTTVFALLFFDVVRFLVKFLIPKADAFKNKKC